VEIKHYTVREYVCFNRQHIRGHAICSTQLFVTIRFQYSKIQYEKYYKNSTWSDNKVRELATACLPWRWTNALVWFYNIDISEFHSCIIVVVDLWQSLSGIYYCLRVFWYASGRMSALELEQRTNIKFLVKLEKSGNEIR
jgi:hypothetical protein